MTKGATMATMMSSANHHSLLIKELFCLSRVCFHLYLSGLPKIPQGRMMRTMAMTMKIKAKASSGLYMIPKE